MEPVEVDVRQGGETHAAGGVHRRLDVQQMVDHGLGPRLVLLLPQEDQFAQEMGVAEGVAAVVRQVGVPEIVNGAAPEAGQDAGGVHGLAPASCVREIPGEPAGRDGVQPVQTARGPHAGFVEAHHVGGGGLRADSYYAQIWTADQKLLDSDPEYWKSRAARLAANPSHEDHGGFLRDERLVEELDKAIAKPETRKNYLRCHLNVPVAEGETPVIDMDLWKAGGGDVDLRTWPEYDVDLLISKQGLLERPCYLGIDCSWTTDLTALACLFPPQTDAEKWKVLTFFWLPEDRLPNVEPPVPPLHLNHLTQSENPGDDTFPEILRK